MKGSMLIYFILYTGTSFSQPVKPNTYNSNPYSRVPQLQLVQNIDSTLICDTYTSGFMALEGYQHTFNADGTYVDSSYNCDGKKFLQQGLWRLISPNQILIGKKPHDFVKYHYFTFLVAATSRKRFIKTVLQAMKVASSYEDKKSSYFPSAVITSMQIMYLSKTN